MALLFSAIVGLCLAIAGVMYWAGDQNEGALPLGGGDSEQPRAQLENAQSQRGSSLAEPKRASANSADDTALLSPGRLLNEAESARDAIKAIELAFGRDDYRVDRLKLFVQGLCSGDLDPKRSLAMSAPDPTRDWAIEAVLDYCEGWSESEHGPVGASDAPEFLFQLDRRLGEQAAIDAANKRMKSSSDWLDINESLEFLHEKGQLPGPSKLGLTDSDYGPVDVREVLHYTTSVVACDLAGGCPARSPLTLRFCVDIGCKPGSSLLDGLRERLSPSQYRLLMAYRNWFLSQRS